MNVATNEVKDLTPFPGVKAQVVDLDYQFPDEILVGLNKENPEKFDVYRLNLQTGEMELEADNPGNIVSWTANAEFKILAATAATADGGRNYYIERLLTNHGKSCVIGMLTKKEEH